MPLLTSDLLMNWSYSYSPWHHTYTALPTNQPPTHPFYSHYTGQPALAGTRKVKPIWILVKQETVSGSGISWAISKSAPHSRHRLQPHQHPTTVVQKIQLINSIIQAATQFTCYLTDMAHIKACCNVLIQTTGCRKPGLRPVCISCTLL